MVCEGLEVIVACMVSLIVAISCRSLGWVGI